MVTTSEADLDRIPPSQPSLSSPASFVTYLSYPAILLLKSPSTVTVGHQNFTTARLKRSQATPVFNFTNYLEMQREEKHPAVLAFIVYVPERSSLLGNITSHTRASICPCPPLKPQRLIYVRICTHICAHKHMTKKHLCRIPSLFFHRSSSLALRPRPTHPVCCTCATKPGLDNNLLSSAPKEGPPYIISILALG